VIGGKQMDEQEKFEAMVNLLAELSSEGKYPDEIKNFEDVIATVPEQGDQVPYGVFRRIPSAVCGMRVEGFLRGARTSVKRCL
jgi:hypothetical protein